MHLKVIGGKLGALDAEELTMNERAESGCQCRVGLQCVEGGIGRPWQLPQIAGRPFGRSKPAGVGVGFKPPKFLRRGDVVRIAIAGIGEIENPVG